MSKYKDWEVVDNQKEYSELERRGLSPRDVFGDDLDQPRHPGVNKEYSLKLNGYDLELLSKLKFKDPYNVKLGQLVNKIAKQVPYQL